MRAGGRAALAGAALAALAAVAGCQATIESGLAEEQANEVLVALDRHGIHGARASEPGAPGGARFSVAVASDDVARALAVLRAEDLPRRPEPGLAETFGEGSLVPTATEERARLAAALGGELARSIESIDGVLDARVHVALPEGGVLLLDAPPPRARASVLVRYRGERAPYDEAAIRRLVAGAVSGLAAEDVEIVGVAAAPPPESGPSLASVGPIAVARGSSGTLRVILGALLGTNVVLAGLLVALARRRRGNA